MEQSRKNWDNGWFQEKPYQEKMNWRKTTMFDFSKGRLTLILKLWGWISDRYIKKYLHKKTKLTNKLEEKLT
jgi:hypothetical protein